MEENNISLLTKENENFLHDYLRKLNVTDYKIDVTSATNPGDNYFGIIARIKIDSQESTLHWIFKAAMQQEKFRLLTGVAELYKRECYIYSTVFKVFEELQMQSGILHQFKSYPKYLTHSLNPPNESIIMEDLKVEGYSIHDRFKTLDYNHVMLAVREYSRFHALSFALRDQKPSLFEEVSKNCQDVLFSNPVMSCEEVIDAANFKFNCIEETIDGSQKSLYKAFIKAKQDFAFIGLKCTKSGVASKYSVICHGDSWNNNLLFQYSNLNNAHAPTSLAIIDWQLSRVGSPILDLTHFLYTCTDKQFRDKYYHEIIEEYYNTFSSFLRNLGSDPEILFPYSEYEEHLKKYSIFGLYMAVQILYLVFSSKDEVPDLHNITSKQDGLKVLNYRLKNNDMYTTRIKDIITDFENLGYNLQI
ncbi:hypothetical protein RN001_000525 [Aquatica leii]|uniref:CHK kinase-like domain-containing protein n=1 Tax=Aquatica leii TaxID=1421715 RepID=A0AAN7Q330_9COLE|nr:hypothetical protein RN001_000525 [Aquatica leii]